MLAWLRRRVAPEDHAIHIPVYAAQVARDFRRDTLEPSPSALMRGANTALTRSTTMTKTTVPSPVRPGTYADIHPGDFIRVGERLVIATSEAELFRAGGLDAFRIPVKLRNGHPSAPVAGPCTDTFRRSTLKGRTIHTLII
jgi:hypothetical protein